MSGLLGGVLPAIYSQADRAKRYLGGLLSDPVGRMQQAGGQAVDDLSKIGLLSEQAFSDSKNPMKMQDNAAARQLVDTYLNSVMNFAPVGMFVGPKSATWDKAAADKAQALAQKGVDPRQIWKETGTFKGPDGAWRQEIDDSVSTMRSGAPLPQRLINGELHADFKVKDAMQHEPLFAAYPSTADIQQSFMSGRGAMGEYKPGMDWISLNKQFAQPMRSEKDAAIVQNAQERLREFTQRPRVQRYERLLDGIADKYGYGDRLEKTINRVGLKIEGEQDRLVQGLLDARAMADARASGVGIADHAKSTQLHELQHAIQQREGWGRGGTPEEMKSLIAQRKSIEDSFNRAMEQMKTATDPVAQQNAYQEFGYYGKKLAELPKVDSPEDAYRLLTGEAEARATQARMNMNMQQRRELFPLDSYDVPLDQLILRR